MVVVGHGVVERQVRGPGTASGPPELWLVAVRRYRCRACKAVFVVGPRGLVAGRWYSAGAIALAFAAYGWGQTGAATRTRTSPWAKVGGSATERWVTLVRWIESARRGELFAVAALGELDRRSVAKQVVLALAGRAGHGLGSDRAASAFAGAAIGV
jgi:hypothetical protein